jgi:hypothetical protein
MVGNLTRVLVAGLVVIWVLVVAVTGVLVAGLAAGV